MNKGLGVLDERTQVNVRIRKDTKRRLEHSARLNNRTFAAEISERLDRSIALDDRASGTREAGESYSGLADAMARLPEDIRQAVTRLIAMAATTAVRDALPDTVTTATPQHKVQQKKARTRKVVVRRQTDKSSSG